ncbi:MAG TPA: GNAT family N-acetyltransferase [Tahibacter sp.]|nr:GNAT family N-acetyltransferase [Tahibacter sp.]
MTIVYRKAVPEDTADCIALRGKTRENAFNVEQLAAVGVTLGSWRAGIDSGACPGYVGMADGRLAGYCFGDRDTGEIVVLALLPEHEGRGIGRTLLNLVIDLLRDCGFEKLFLSCSADPTTRSYGFYRRLGWQFTGSVDDAGDEVLEYALV